MNIPHHSLRVLLSYFALPVFFLCIFISCIQPLPVQARPSSDDPLYNNHFYLSATPAQVRETIGSKTLEKRKLVKEWVKTPTLGLHTRKSGFSVQREYTSALYIAAFYTTYPEVIDILVKAGQDVNEFDDIPAMESILRRARRNQNPDIVAAVLRHNPSKGTKEMELFSITSGGLTSGAPDNILRYMDMLLAAGVNINTVFQSKTPLMVAVSNKNIAMVQALLKRGADPNVLHNSDRTALWCAMGEYDLAMMNMLMDAGANPTARYGHRTLLDAFVQAYAYTITSGKELINAYSVGSEAVTKASQNAKKEYRNTLKKMLAAYPPKSKEAKEALERARKEIKDEDVFKIFRERGVPGA